MEEIDTFFFKHRVNGLCISSKYVDIPTFIIKMTANIKCIAFYPAPAVRTQYVDECWVRNMNVCLLLIGCCEHHLNIHARQI